MKAHHRKSEARKSLLGPKAKIFMGAWNVCTMYETSKTAQVIREIKRYGLDILGISGPRTENGSGMECAGRKPGRPKTTWRRTVMAELSEVKLTWGEAQHAAQNRAKWKEIVVALCPTGDEEE